MRIGGSRGLSAVPSNANTPVTAPATSSNPVRFDHGPVSPCSTTFAWIRPGCFEHNSSAVSPKRSWYPFLFVDSKRIRPHHSTTDSFFLDLSFHVNQGCLTSYRHETSSRKDLIPSRVAARCLGHLLRKGPGLYQYLIRRSHVPSLGLALHPEESYLQI